MTVDSSTNRKDYDPDGLVTVFAYDFRVDDADDLVVYADGVEVTSGFTVDNIGVEGGGDVTFAVAPLATVEVLTLIREVPLTQQTAYPALGPFPASSHEEALDKLTFIAQQQEETLDRAILFGVDYTGVAPTAEEFAASIEADSSAAASGFADAAEASSIEASGYSDAAEASSIEASGYADDAEASSIAASGFADDAAASAASVAQVYVDTIADLRLLEGTSEQAIQVKGYYSVGDGGGGPIRYWDVGTYSSGDDNGGSVIVATGVTTGAWLFGLQESISIDDFGAKGDWNGSTGTDDYLAVNAAAAYALSSGVVLTDSGKDYYIENTVNISVACDFTGTFIFNDDLNGNLMHIEPFETPIAVTETGLTGITEGNVYVTGLPTGYKGSTFIIESTEVLTKRYQAGGGYSPYTMNDACIIMDDNSTTIAPAFDSTYSNLSLATAYIKPYEKPISINGLSIEFHGVAHVVNYTIQVTKDNVTMNNLSAVNKSTDKNLKAAISTNVCTNFTLNYPKVLDNPKITTGDNYGISLGISAFTNINNGTCMTSTSITGRHTKQVKVLGGQYNEVDNHWGNRFTIDGVTMFSPVTYAGSNLTIINSIMHRATMCFVRSDTPEIKGDIIIKYNKQISQVASLSVLAESNTGLDNPTFFGRTLKSADTIEIAFNTFEVTGTPTWTNLCNYRAGSYAANNYSHEPIGLLYIHDNKFQDGLPLGFNWKKNVDYQPTPDRNPRVVVQNEDTQGASLVAYIGARDDSTTANDDWGWEVEFNNCKSLSMVVDYPTVRSIYVNGGSIKYLWRVNAKSGAPDNGYMFLDNVTLEAATMRYMKYSLTNCFAEGVNTVTAGEGTYPDRTGYVQTFNNHVRTGGTISSSFYTDLLNSDYFDY